MRLKNINLITINGIQIIHKQNVQIYSKRFNNKHKIPIIAEKHSFSLVKTLSP